MPSVDDAGHPIPNPEATYNRKASLASLGSMILVCVVFFWMSVWIIPRFAVIFRDMLEGRPLPGLTALVISSRGALLSFDCGCALLAAILIRFKVSSRYLIAISLLLVGQVSVAAIALSIPLIRIIQTLGR